MNYFQLKQAKTLFCLIMLGGVIFFASVLAPKEAFAVSSVDYAGITEFDTAVIEAKAAYPNGSSSAVLVGSGPAWPDALSASGLAASRGPILYTGKNSLHASTAKALSDMGVQKVVIVGGSSVVSEGVVQDLSKIGISLEARLAGDDCYGTQMEVYNFGVKNNLWVSDFAIVATGESFADALSASPVAFAKKAPIFLVDNKGSLREDQKQALIRASETGEFSRILVVGGTAVVSDITVGFLDYVTAIASPSGFCERIAGTTQYDTSTDIANWAVGQGILSWANPALSSGRLPYDALAGSVLQGKSGSVLLLVDGISVSTINAVVNNRGSISTLRFFGGTSMIPDGVRSYIKYSMQFGFTLPMGATRLSNGAYLWCNSSGVDRQAAIDQVISIARSCLGIPYVWLGRYPEDGGMDCASFTWHIYTRKLGMEIGFETYDQMYAGYKVNSLSEARPGDIILMYYGGWPNYNPYLPEHVVLYAGDGMIYEEPDFGMYCRYVPLSSKGANRIEIRRIIQE